MTDTIKKLEISHKELDVIANALETQSKILRMQASAGGIGAVARLNEVKRVLATVSSQRDAVRPKQPESGSWLGLLRLMGQTT
jgi:ribosomal protein L29